MFHHKVKKEKAKQGEGKRGNEREGEKTTGKPLTRKCQSLRKEKTIESSDREEQKKKPGKLKESLFLILPLFLSTLPSLVPRDARCARAARRDEGGNKITNLSSSFPHVPSQQNPIEPNQNSNAKHPANAKKTSSNNKKQKTT